MSDLSAPPRAAAFRTLRTSDDIADLNLLGISASRKPGPGMGTRSASAGVLRFALESLAGALPGVGLLDLRDVELPLFDGRRVEEWTHADVEFLAEAVEAAPSLIFSVPGYWAGPSGVFKNLLDLLGGAHYDDTVPKTLLSGKPFGLIVVGADRASAIEADRQARLYLEALGAREVADPVVLANPRHAAWDETQLAESLDVLLASVAKAGLA